MGRRWRRRVAVAATVAGLLRAPGVILRAHPAAPCTGAMPGGDWATYGGVLYGSQRQHRERTIGVGNVARLEQAWITADTGYQAPPPIVSGGCVFINTNGHIEAFDLATGKTVWQST